MKETTKTTKAAYFKRLSPYQHKGPCGQPLVEDPPETLLQKAEKLADWIRQSNHLVCLTGAGISTSAGIRDFRGPNGVWTMEDRGAELPEEEATSGAFENASPTFTHLALLELFKAGKLKYLISQNVDGLHLRSGFPGHALGELHGNLFTEYCKRCKSTILRDTDVGGVGLKETGNPCTKCGQRMFDTVLDWESELPKATLKESRRHSREADLVLCLGTSLRIEPAAGIPFLNMKGGKRVVICNLQKTPKDKKAHLLVHGKVDEVMRMVMDRLGMAVPPFTPLRRLFIAHTLEQGTLTVSLTSDGLREPAFLKGSSVALVVDANEIKMARQEGHTFSANCPAAGVGAVVPIAITAVMKISEEGIGDDQRILNFQLVGARGCIEHLM